MMSNQDSTLEAMNRRGDEAWEALMKNHDWHRWVELGESLVAGRAWAKREANIGPEEQPSGRLGSRYNAAFGQWLDERKFRRMEPSDRNWLFKIMEHIGEITSWRATLTDGERLRLNHPKTVFNKWKAHTQVPGAAKAKPTSKAKLTEESLAEALEKNDQLKKELARAKSGIDLDRPDRDIAVEFVDQLTVVKEGAYSLHRIKSILREISTEVAFREKASKPKSKKERRGPDEFRADVERAAPGDNDE